MAQQYCLYMQNPFWRAMSDIGAHDDTCVNTRFYSPSRGDARFSPLPIYSDTNYYLAPTRASEGISSYKVALTDTSGMSNPAQTLGNFRSCVKATGNPKACARIDISRVSCCNGR